MHFNTITHTIVATGPGVQKRFVSYAGKQAGAADLVLGVAMTDAVVNQPLTLHVLGVAAVESGGAVAAGAPVIPDAQGRGVADGGTAANRVGHAVNAVTAAGQTLFVLFK